MHEIKHGTYRLIVQPESKRVAADADLILTRSSVAVALRRRR
jgi:hypothetical protein